MSAMNCPICGYHNICPSCNDWLCDNCGAELLGPDRFVERQANDDDQDNYNSCYIQR